MARISGKTVLITGATSGIGAACAVRFASEGANLVLWARREARLNELKSLLSARHGVDVVTAVLDVRDRDRVATESAWLVAMEKLPDVLLNNAGLARGLSPLQEGSFSDWDEMIDTNIKGVLNVSRSLLPHMIARGTGHIVNIGSIAGHWTYAKGNVYAATKFAIRGLTEGMNLDLAGTALKVSSVDPGLVETEFSEVRFHGDKARAKDVYKGMQPLSPDDIADTISYIVNAPDHVNIFDVVMMPTAQRNATTVDRKS